MADRYVTLAADTTAIGPNGGGITLPAGTYQVYDADGVPDSVLYLLDPANEQRIVGCVQASDVVRQETDHV
ncbi:hypothetical protein AB0B94_30865 [Micromonospora sp. NPDC048986]|uniref:hypothetical protein n=1 Tax=Micromonospora sp. NPDC048986 TaxID=3155644 RepID=UPI0033F6D546